MSNSRIEFQKFEGGKAEGKVLDISKDGLVVYIYVPT